MNIEELIEELENLFIITRIGSEYFISQDIIKSRNKPEEMGSPANKSPVKAEYKEVLSKPNPVSNWPFEIVHSRGRKRAEAFMAYGKVPNISSVGNYRLRGLNNDAIKVIEKLVDRNPNIKSDLLFKEVAYYYKTTEYPKTFKNFVLEGDMLDIYNEALERLANNVSRIDPDKGGNTTWG